jgi:hypothetical protein
MVVPATAKRLSGCRAMRGPRVPPRRRIRRRIGVQHCGRPGSPRNALLCVRIGLPVRRHHQWPNTGRPRHLLHACVLVSDWRVEYNHRPHSALGMLEATTEYTSRRRTEPIPHTYDGGHSTTSDHVRWLSVGTPTVRGMMRASLPRHIRDLAIAHFAPSSSQHAATRLEAVLEPSRHIRQIWPHASWHWLSTV